MANITKKDITNLGLWITRYLEKTHFQRLDCLHDFDEVTWLNELQTLTQDEIAMGFINFSNLIMHVERSNLGFIPLTAKAFKCLCEPLPGVDCKILQKSTTGTNSYGK